MKDAADEGLAVGSEGCPRAGQGDPGDETAYDRSLYDDLESLIEGGKAYFEAELQYQKTRAGHAAQSTKRAVIYATGAAFLVLMALVALTVGGVIALSGPLGPWAATGIVTLAWTIGAAACAWAARRNARRVAIAMQGKP